MADDVRRSLIVLKKRPSNADELLARMERLADLLRHAEWLFEIYEREMDELVRAMNGEAKRRWAKRISPRDGDGK